MTKTNQKACQQCGQLLPTDAQFCPHCGATIGDGTPRACPRCGKPNAGTARFCQQCGANLLEPGMQPSGGQTAPQAKPAWGQVALGGLGGLLLGSLFGGGRGGFGGWGDNDDFGGGGDFGGGDSGGGDFGGGGDGG